MITKAKFCQEESIFLNRDFMKSNIISALSCPMGIYGLVTIMVTKGHGPRLTRHYFAQPFPRGAAPEDILCELSDTLADPQYRIQDTGDGTCIRVSENAYVCKYLIASVTCLVMVEQKTAITRALYMAICNSGRYSEYLELAKAGLAFHLADGPSPIAAGSQICIRTADSTVSCVTFPYDPYHYVIRNPRSGLCMIGSYHNMQVDCEKNGWTITAVPANAAYDIS